MNETKCLVFTLCLLLSMPVFALRCDRTLIQPGDFKEDVLEYCGDPDSVQSHYEKRANVNYADISQYNRNRRFSGNSITYGQSNYRDVEVLVEEWVYNFGSSRLRKLLRFENGRLVEVISLGKGKYHR